MPHDRYVWQRWLLQYRTSILKPISKTRLVKSHLSAISISVIKSFWMLGTAEILLCRDEKRFDNNAIHHEQTRFREFSWASGELMRDNLVPRIIYIVLSVYYLRKGVTLQAWKCFVPSRCYLYGKYQFNLLVSSNFCFASWWFFVDISHIKEIELELFLLN